MQQRTRALAIVALALLAGCEESMTAVEESRDLVRAGWRAFESSDPIGALSKFNAALEKQPDSGDAQNGSGWCLLKLGLLRESVDRFTRALHSKVRSAEPFAGRAIAYLGLEPAQCELAIASARNALARERDFIFVHDPTVTWHDLRWIMAAAFYSLERYEEANAEVDSIGGKPQNPASPTFVQDLLLEIERLSRLLSGR